VMDRRLLLSTIGFMRRAITSLVVLGLGLLGPAGCITPSIPIPPPDPAQMDFHLTTIDPMTSTAVLTYPQNDTYRGGVAFLYNRFKHQGVIQDVNPSGSIGPTPPMPAVLGDEVVVSVQVNDQTISSCVVLREGAQDPTTYCGP
jgi:hypothetical protein